MAWQTDELELPLVDPNQIDKALTINEAITGIAKSLAAELELDFDVLATPYTLPYDADEGADKSGLQVFLYRCIGTPAGAVVVNHPAVRHYFIVINDTDQNVTFKVAGQTGITLATTESTNAYCDGTDVIDVGNLAGSGGGGGGTVDYATAAEVYSAAAGDKVFTTELIETASAFVALTDAGTIAFDWDAGINRSLTIGGNRTLGNPTNGQPGTWRTIVITQDGTGTRTLSFGNQYRASEGLASIVLSTGAGEVDVLQVLCVTSTLFYVFLANDMSV